MALTKKQLEELKAQLILEQKRILGRLEKLEKASTSMDSDLKGDDADVAAVQLSHEQLNSLGQREAKVLKLIKHALGKFDEGTYGECEFSGEMIPIARLRISPWAKYTVEAKEEIERKERAFKKKGGEDWNKIDENDND